MVSATSLRRRTSPSWPLLVLAVVLLISLLLVTVVLRAKPPARLQPITLVTAEWEPYISSELPESGPLARIATQTLLHAGYDPSYTFTTWQLAQRDVLEGGAIGVVAMVDSGTRDEQFIYSDPLLELRYTLFGHDRDDLVSIAQRKDLTGLRVARIEGYDYWRELDESGAEFVTFQSAEDAFLALVEGDVDLVAEDSLAGRALVDGPDFPGDGSLITEVPGASDLTTSSQGLHVLLSDTPEGRRLQEHFNASLAEYRTTPDYAEHVAALDQMQQTVALRSPEGPVELLDGSGATIGITPTGTTGVVDAWPEAPTSPDAMVRVKVLDGPWAGRIVKVPMREVEITHA